MSEGAAAPLDAIRADYRHCFACGRDNPIGLRLDGFRSEGEEVVVAFTPRPDYGGFHGVLHGGIVATALDEIMAWAAMLRCGVFVYTGTMDVRFRSPAPVDATYEMRGEVNERRGRRLLLAGRMLHEGRAVAEGSGLYLVKEEITTP